MSEESLSNTTASIRSPQQLLLPLPDNSPSNYLTAAAAIHSSYANQAGNVILTLPDPIVIKIFSYLPCDDRISASYCCKKWRRMIDSPDVWVDCEVAFCGPKDVKNFMIAKRYGQTIKQLKITIDQTYEFNRKASRKFLYILSMKKMKRMSDFVIRFTGHNPLFYKSTQYVDCLVALFSNGQRPTIADDSSCFWLDSLRSIDFEGLLVAIPDRLLETVAQCHCQIKTINLLDASLVCLISSKALVRFLEACVHLENLAVFRACLSKKALHILSREENERSQLKSLTIQFRHDEKFAEQIEEELWKDMVQRNPNIEVNLIFDKSCQQNRIALHLLPSLPVTKLTIHSTIRLFHEINLAALYYAHSLEELELKFDVEWALSPTQAVDNAVRRLVECAEKLQVLRIFCGLSMQTLQLVKDKFFNVYNNPRTLLFQESEY